MTIKKYNFDHSYDRNNTNSFKWDGRKKFLGYENILPMHVADMDFPVAPEIQEALIKTAQNHFFGYSIHSNNYYDNFINWNYRRHNWNIQENWCLHSVSVVTSIACALEAYSNEGDGILIQTPVYHLFSEMIKLHKRKVVVNKLKYTKNFDYEIDFDDLENKFKTEKPKIFIFCNPHNPVGRVWTKTELEKISDLCLKYNILILSDEIHCELIYDSFKFIPIASINKDVSNITITCMSPSKTFNLAGIGASVVVIENKGLREKLFHEFSKNHLEIPTVFSIAAFESAFKVGEPWLNQLLIYLNKNKKILENWAEKYSNKLTLTKIEATYLAWISFKKTKLNDGDLKKKMFEEANVAFDVGTKFGNGGEGFMRLNFGCPENQLNEALSRVSKILDNLNE